ncbi:methyl-accepting chemotaxis protein [Sporomusa sphaeroides]|uniref:Methyl-accepting chemotaxis protein McpB n=1 Tax=Sporomusa sphaeroides DSM 2875 TaxID=1337886 RepID=A0ABM9W7H7_9FIRM|nr:methyl-accepting chemotaxis protein [Sporomusa sphaeroides]OLS54626.1 methyl-accepting chemotaxis protein McpB [Sporomusa sphaeroides DSM 2875]CVK20843.1 Methyl-accepting chemotaxis protein McpB [Sporomusa sphaeroides DSM 2875]
MGQKLFQGIRLKLIANSILLILIAVLPLGIILNAITQAALLKSYFRTSEQQIQTINEAINLFQGAVDKDITMFAANPLILKADNTITKYMDIDMKKVMTPSKNGGIEQEIFQAFEHYGKTHPGTLYVYMGTESGGYVLWPEDSIWAHYDPRERPWYKAALNGNDTISRTAPYVDASAGGLGGLIVSNATPIKNSEGQVIGVMGIDASTARITEILNGIKIGETGYCMMIHKSGMILADPSNPQNNNKYVKDIGIEGLENILEAPQVQTELTINGIHFAVVSAQASNSDWVIATFLPTQELYKTSTEIRNNIILISIATLIIGLIITLITSNKIARPITMLSDVARSIAGGDLGITVRCSGVKNEIGVLENSIGQMVANLRSMIAEATQASEQLAAASEELTAISANSVKASEQVAASVNDMAKNTSGQLAETNDTLLVVEKMSTSIKQVDDNITVVASQSNQVVEKANDSRILVSKAANQMEQIENTVNNSAKVVSKLGERSREIGQIVDTITGIAGQTNLLALNAAIEAARAGERGRGFTVVAEEVRKLAEQSQAATKQIATLINEIQADTNEAVAAMDNGTQEVKLGVELLNASGKSFQEIAEMINEVSNKVMEISLLSNQMQGGSRQIVESVKRINESNKNSFKEAETIASAATEQSVAMDEIASASQSLATLAQSLQDSIRNFGI